MENFGVRLGEIDTNGETIKILVDCEKEGRQNRAKQTPPSICMVPSVYRDRKPSCFDPQVVSIGPLHRAHKNVQQLEGLKATYLHDLLARNSDSLPKQTMEACLWKVLSSIDRIKTCYAGLKNYSDFELATMMITDACFILEFIQKCCVNKGLCWGNPLVIYHIIPDLVLQENQIPFFVLQDIFDCTLLKISQGSSLISLLREHVLDKIKPFEAQLEINTNIDYKHILDILHTSYQPPRQPTSGPTQPRAIPFAISDSPVAISHSALDLDLAGVNFKPNPPIQPDEEKTFNPNSDEKQTSNLIHSEETNINLNNIPDEKKHIWPLDIQYEQPSNGLHHFSGPALRMPILTIHDNTELVLRNLIAYEQSRADNNYYFTSFAWAMDMLVDSTEDVIKLVESKVVVNYLGSNEKAADMINGICNELPYTGHFSYSEQWEKLDNYYNGYWPKHMARLRRTYFNSPWNIIALVAGIILFVLTVIQTIYATKPGDEHSVYRKP